MVVTSISVSNVLPNNLTKLSQKSIQRVISVITLLQEIGPQKLNMISYEIISPCKPKLQLWEKRWYVADLIADWKSNFTALNCD